MKLSYGCCLLNFLQYSFIGKLKIMNIINLLFKNLFKKNENKFSDVAINEIRRKAFLADKSYELTKKHLKADSGIEISEISFDQFERRKKPREDSINFKLVA